MFKGGAIWTMYYEDGKEADEFRLLHVYYSNKRATNKKARTTKRRKPSTEPAPEMTPPRSRLSTFPTSPQLSPPASVVQSPTVTNDTDSAGILSSPMSMARSQSGSVSEFWPSEQPIVTPINDILPRSPSDQKTLFDDDEMSSLQSQSVVGTWLPSPFRRPAKSGLGVKMCSSPLQRTGEYGSRIVPKEEDGCLDYIPPPEDLRSIMTEPIMSYDDDDSFISGMGGLCGVMDDYQLPSGQSQAQDSLADLERKLDGDPFGEDFEVDYRNQMSLPDLESPQV